MTTEISDYERQRLANIERNAKYLSELGIDPVPKRGRAAVKTSSNSTKKRKPSIIPVPDAEVYGLRRSSRVASLQPVDYTEVRLIKYEYVYCE